MNPTTTSHARPEAPTPVPARGHTRRRLFSASATVALLVLALTVLAPASALAITRDAVFTRAQSWVDRPVPYSRVKHHLGYRTDCSGYVSMCWATGTSWSTSSFHSVTHRITTSQLKPGDALLKKGYHIRLFQGWTDATHTSYVAYEANTIVAVVRVHAIADDLKAGYVPVRYDRVTDGAKPLNVLRNRSFDAWTRTWGPQGEQPVWWEVSGAEWETLALHRTDIRRTGRSSLQLLNPSTDAEEYTELSQAASVTAGALYRVSAWARTDSDPAGLKLRVAYLDASGASIAETSTTGSRWAVSGSVFKQMSAMATAPANAKSARVTIQLAGGATGGLEGTSVILDDVSLYRPQATVRIKASATSARAGRKVVVSGSVSPTSSVGVNAVVYVKRPGSGWKRFASAPIVASGGTAAWRANFAFKRGMRRGVYRFRTTVPGFAGYVGATSSTVSVRLK